MLETLQLRTDSEDEMTQAFLTQVTEMELLSGKNFGETSLVEIRE